MSDPQIGLHVKATADTSGLQQTEAALEDVQGKADDAGKAVEAVGTKPDTTGINDAERAIGDVEAKAKDAEQAAKKLDESLDGIDGKGPQSAADDVSDLGDKTRGAADEAKNLERGVSAINFKAAFGLGVELGTQLADQISAAADEVDNLSAAANAMGARLSEQSNRTRELLKNWGSVTALEAERAKTIGEIARAEADFQKLREGTAQANLIARWGSDISSATEALGGFIEQRKNELGYLDQILTKERSRTLELIKQKGLTGDQAAAVKAADAAIQDTVVSGMDPTNRLDFYKSQIDQITQDAQAVFARAGKDVSFNSPATLSTLGEMLSGDSMVGVKLMAVEWANLAKQVQATNDELLQAQQVAPAATRTAQRKTSATGPSSADTTAKSLDATAQAADATAPAVADAAKTTETSMGNLATTAQGVAGQLPAQLAVQEAAIADALNQMSGAYLGSLSKIALDLKNHVDSLWNEIGKIWAYAKANR